MNMIKEVVKNADVICLKEVIRNPEFMNTLLPMPFKKPYITNIEWQVYGELAVFRSDVTNILIHIGEDFLDTKR